MLFCSKGGRKVVETIDFLPEKFYNVYSRKWREKMGYLYVALALLSGGIKAFCGKKISGKTPTIKNAILTNFIRMLFCIAFGFLFVLAENLDFEFVNITVF